MGVRVDLAQEPEKFSVPGRVAFGHSVDPEKPEKCTEQNRTVHSAGPNSLSSQPNCTPRPAFASTTCGARARVLSVRFNAGVAEHGHLVALIGTWGVEPHACVHFCWCVAGCCNRRAV